MTDNHRRSAARDVGCTWQSRASCARRGRRSLNRRGAASAEDAPRAIGALSLPRERVGLQRRARRARLGRGLVERATGVGGPRQVIGPRPAGAGAHRFVTVITKPSRRDTSGAAVDWPIRRS